MIYFLGIYRCGKLSKQDADDKENGKLTIFLHIVIG